MFITFQISVVALLIVWLQVNRLVTLHLRRVINVFLNRNWQALDSDNIRQQKMFNSNLLLKKIYKQFVVGQSNSLFKIVQVRFCNFVSSANQLAALWHWEVTLQLYKRTCLIDLTNYPSSTSEGREHATTQEHPGPPCSVREQWPRPASL